MQDSIILAEKILMIAARSGDGVCFPSDIDVSLDEQKAAIEHLKVYGICHNTRQGPRPIFRINQAGEFFASQGAWSEKERRETIEEERYNKQISISKNAEKYAFSTLIATIIGIIITIIINIIR